MFEILYTGQMESDNQVVKYKNINFPYIHAPSIPYKLETLHICSNIKKILIYLNGTKWTDKYLGNFRCSNGLSCEVSNSTHMLQFADALMFAHPNPVPIVRNQRQKTVGISMESPLNGGLLDKANFDFFASYRNTSDIPLTYAPAAFIPYKMKHHINQKKLICAILSNCAKWRMDIIRELQQCI